MYRCISYELQEAYRTKKEPIELGVPWDFFWIAGEIKTVIISLETLKREKQDAHLTSFRWEYSRHLKISSHHLDASHFEGRLFNYKKKKRSMLKWKYCQRRWKKKKKEKTNLTGGFTFYSMKLGHH